MENRLTTLQHQLTPSQELIDFNYTKDAIESGNVQSLTYSISLQKIPKDSSSKKYSSRKIEGSKKFKIKLHAIDIEDQPKVKNYKKIRSNSCNRKIQPSYRQRKIKYNLKTKRPLSFCINNQNTDRLKTFTYLKKDKKSIIKQLPTASTFSSSLFKYSPERQDNKLKSNLIKISPYLQGMPLKLKQALYITQQSKRIISRKK